MLQITIPATELWDERKQEFVNTKAQTLLLEHSLISLSKWESKWCKPFLTKDAKTIEETVDYIRCMTVTPNVDPKAYDYLTNENITQVNEYISAPMTATWFTEDKKAKASREQITNELIYYWMIALQIPFDPCEKWHLNHLLTLIKVCNIKNQQSSDPGTKNKKMSSSDLARRNAINAARRKQLNTRG